MAIWRASPPRHSHVFIADIVNKGHNPNSIAQASENQAIPFPSHGEVLACSYAWVYSRINNKPNLTIIAWSRRAKKISKPFVLDVRPGTEQSDWDQKVFNPDWTLKPDWKVSVQGVKTRRGWEHEFRNKKTGEIYMDVDMLRYRQLWAQRT